MDADARLEALAREHGAHLLRVAYQLTHDRAGAQDVVQEALLRVLQSWQRHHPTVTEPAAYLRRAVVNEYLRTRRLRSSTEIVTDDVPERAARSFETDHAERDAVWRQLESLPPRQRTVLVLRYYEGMPDREIAAIVGCREATVRSLTSRALGVLRLSEPLAPPAARIEEPERGTV
jgi:RNA polymerase sigma-70 factor (sigma-E family)